MRETKMKKKLIPIFIIVLIIIVLIGCNEKKDMPKDDLIDLSDISIVKVIEANKLIFNDIEEQLNFTAIKTITQELIDKKEFDLVKELLVIVDKAGYKRSAVYGMYCTDNSKKTIHKTESKCVDNIEIQYLEPVNSFNYDCLLETMKSKYYYNYVLCKQCFDK